MRIGIFLKAVALPLAIAILLSLICRPLYSKDGHIDYFILWICIGFPFGIRHMFLWLVPRGFDLAGTVGVFALNIVLGGLIGGLAFCFQIIKGCIATIKG